jgi:hypothetical protein
MLVFVPLSSACTIFREAFLLMVPYFPVPLATNNLKHHDTTRNEVIAGLCQEPALGKSSESWRPQRGRGT